MVYHLMSMPQKTQPAATAGADVTGTVVAAGGDSAQRRSLNTSASCCVLVCRVRSRPFTALAHDGYRQFWFLCAKRCLATVLSLVNTPEH
jgi:hypothetical protein